MCVQLTQLTRRRLVGSALASGAIMVANPHPTFGQEATPVEGADTVGVFAEMLALVPDVLARPEFPQHLEFGDMPAQLAAVGQVQPESRDDPAFERWFYATHWILLPPDVRNSGLAPEFRDLFGFDLLQVDQGLSVGDQPEMMTFLRGRFDETELRSAWGGAGYQELDEGGTTVFSLAEGPEIDVATPVHQIVAGRFNNAAILADGTVVFAASLDLMREALAVAAGRSPSLAEHNQVAAVLTTVDQPLASAIILDGAALEIKALLDDPRLPSEVVAKIQEEVEQSGEMPPSRITLFGVTPGGPIPPPLGEPEATPTPTDNLVVWVIRLLVESPADAELAAETIPNRIATLTSLPTNRPYAEMVTVRRSEALGDPPAVALDLDFVAGEVHPSLWYESIFQQDLLFLAY